MDELTLLLSGQPVFLKIVTLMGLARVVCKPLFAVVIAYVKYTPTTSDDDLMNKIISNKAYKTASFVIDWVLSVKLPQKK